MVNYHVLTVCITLGVTYLAGTNAGLNGLESGESRDSLSNSQRLCSPGAVSTVSSITPAEGSTNGDLSFKGALDAEKKVEIEKTPLKPKEPKDMRSNSKGKLQLAHHMAPNRRKQRLKEVRF
jgi:hypothetical protein